MKPNDYIKQHFTAEGKLKDQNALFRDLIVDLETSIEVQTGDSKTIKTFNNNLKVIKMKWDSINNKLPGNPLPDKLWKYFYAAYLVPYRDAMYPEDAKKIYDARKQREEDNRRYREYQAFHDPFAGFRFDFGKMFEAYMMLFRDSTPYESFRFMGLEAEVATVESVNKQYKVMSLVLHPDKGGSHDGFIQLTTAKNNILNYLKSK